jgi:hypothetical protein
MVVAMAVFSPGQPIRTTTARVAVDPGLKPGRYLFRLVVSNAAGDRSQASEWIVTVRDPPAPPSRSAPPASPPGGGIRTRLSALVARLVGGSQLRRSA